MDHIFEQKLVRENQQLQLELGKLNKQIKQLQEKVVGYEQVLSQLDEAREGKIRRTAQAYDRTEKRLATISSGIADMTRAGQMISGAAGEAYRAGTAPTLAAMKTQQAALEAKRNALRSRADRLTTKREGSLAKRSGNVQAQLDVARVTGQTSKSKFGSPLNVRRERLDIARTAAQEAKSDVIGTYQGLPMRSATRSSKEVMSAAQQHDKRQLTKLPKTQG